MVNSLQLLSFSFSFFFGIFFSFVSRFHYGFISSLKGWFRYLLTFLFILDISLCYILLIYYINQGVVHLYFVIFTMIGYGLEKYVYPHVKNHVKFRRFVDSKSQK